MAKAIHNTSKFAFSVGGHSVRGFKDGDAVSVTFPDDTSTPYTGTKGEGGIVIGSSRVAEITVGLVATSESVAAIYALNKAAVEAGGDALPFVYKQRSGESTYTVAGTCLLKKNFDITSSKDMTEIDLEFISADAVPVII